MSDLIGHPVFLKLENVQPTQSFKIRGVSRLSIMKLKEGYHGFVTASGGNTGVALAYTAYLLKKPCYVFVPSLTSINILQKMKAYGAHVVMEETGKKALDAAIVFAKKYSHLALIHPFDDAGLWASYASIVQEVKENLPESLKPSCFVASVGGGGLVTGILKGMENMGWQDVPVVAVETFGAHSLHRSLEAGKIVENVPMTSIAKCLGAPFVTQTLMDMIPSFNFVSHVMEDEEAVDACLKFAGDHGFLVEPASGVSLATVYSKILPHLLTKNGLSLDGKGPVIIIVCGGGDTDPEKMVQYGTSMGLI